MSLGRFVILYHCNNNKAGIAYSCNRKLVTLWCQSIKRQALSNMEYKF